MFAGWTYPINTFYNYEEIVAVFNCELVFQTRQIYQWIHPNTSWLRQFTYRGCLKVWLWSFVPCRSGYHTARIKYRDSVAASYLSQLGQSTLWNLLLKRLWGLRPLLIWASRTASFCVEPVKSPSKCGKSHEAYQQWCFKIKCYIFFWYFDFVNIFLIEKMNNFQGDLTDVSAKHASLRMNWYI